MPGWFRPEVTDEQELFSISYGCAEQVPGWFLTRVTDEKQLFSISYG